MLQVHTSIGTGRHDRKHWITVRPTGTVGFEAIHCLEEERDEEGVLVSLGKPLGRLEPEDERPLQAHTACHFPIDSNDPLSMVLFIASNRSAAFLVSFATLLSWVFMGLFLVYIYGSAEDVKMYGGGWDEWAMIGYICVAVLIPAVHDALKPFALIKQLLEFANKAQPEVRPRLWLATSVVALDMLQPLALLLLSMFVAIWLSDDDFMDAVLNVVALQFVGSLDNLVIGKFVEVSYSGACLSVVLLDVNYNFPGVNYDGEMAFWDSSDSSREDTSAILNSQQTSITQKWDALTSGSRGLGLLGKWSESHHVEGCRGQPTVQSIVLRTKILRWTDVSFNSANKEQLGLFLAGVRRLSRTRTPCAALMLRTRCTSAVVPSPQPSPRGRRRRRSGSSCSTKRCESSCSGCTTSRRRASPSRDRCISTDGSSPRSTQRPSAASSSRAPTCGTSCSPITTLATRESWRWQARSAAAPASKASRCVTSAWATRAPKRSSARCTKMSASSPVSSKLET